MDTRPFIWFLNVIFVVQVKTRFISQETRQATQLEGEKPSLLKRQGVIELLPVRSYQVENDTHSVMRHSYAMHNDPDTDHHDIDAHIVLGHNEAHLDDHHHHHHHHHEDEHHHDEEHHHDDDHHHGDEHHHDDEHHEDEHHHDDEHHEDEHHHDDENHDDEHHNHDHYDNHHNNHDDEEQSHDDHDDMDNEEQHHHSDHNDNHYGNHDHHDDNHYHHHVHVYYYPHDRDDNHHDNEHEDDHHDKIHRHYEYHRYIGRHDDENDDHDKHRYYHYEEYRPSHSSYENEHHSDNHVQSHYSENSESGTLYHNKIMEYGIPHSITISLPHGYNGHTDSESHHEHSVVNKLITHLTEALERFQAKEDIHSMSQNLATTIANTLLLATRQNENPSHITLHDIIRIVEGLRESSHREGLNERENYHHRDEAIHDILKDRLDVNSAVRTNDDLVHQMKDAFSSLLQEIRNNALNQNNVLATTSIHHHYDREHHGIDGGNHDNDDDHFTRHPAEKVIIIKDSSPHKTLDQILDSHLSSHDYGRHDGDFLHHDEDLFRHNNDLLHSVTRNFNDEHDNLRHRELLQIADKLLGMLTTASIIEGKNITPKRHQEEDSAKRSSSIGARSNRAQEHKQIRKKLNIKNSLVKANITQNIPKKMHKKILSRKKIQGNK